MEPGARDGLGADITVAARVGAGGAGVGAGVHAVGAEGLCVISCRSRRSPGSKDWLGRPIEAVVGAVTRCGN